MAKCLTKKCIVCRKQHGKPLEQIMGQTPSLRVGTGLPPFHNTALDMVRPFRIKLNWKTVKEAQIVIFTCMTTRAIHLELVTDRSTATFLMFILACFCLFVWTTDEPVGLTAEQIFSEPELPQEIMQDWDIPRIQSVLSEEFACDFKWKWNTPHASHQNGVVESLIKSVRQAFNFTCKEPAFAEEQ